VGHYIDRCISILLIAPIILVMIYLISYVIGFPHL